MRNSYGLRWLFLVSALIVAIEMSACAMVGALPFGGDSWKEEVLLHDGSKVVVERKVERGGRHEVGQPSPIKEHTVTFTLSHTGQTITWTSEYDESLGRTNFHLLAVHVLNGTPYIVTEPNLCLSYNKWGRPNPPYVFFKYDGTAWQRIPLEAVPTEFITLNVAISLDTRYVRDMVSRRVVPAETIRERNSQLPQPEYKTILREPVKSGGSQCGEMIHVGNGRWIGTGWFRDQPSRDACFKYCEQKNVPASQCPCATLFKEE